MVSKLETSRAELVETARLAGRSEVARAVLHNVGNVLNSVNVSAVELRRGVGDGALADLARLDAMLAGHEDDLSRWIAEDPRGRHLPAFLVELARHGREQHAALMAEAGHLADGLEHVSALVRAQADNVSAAEPAERVDVARQLDCALKLSDDGQPVEVRRDYAAVPELLLPRHRLLEVLVNLLRNARQSLRDAPVEARQLVVRVARHADHVRVEVVDNGLGIAKEHLLRIFQQHFTTKRDGHGIGLHAAANAARELGGTLQAYSDGPGTGATFVLELPVAGPAGGSVA
jgi:signal transduction histidine kinase